ncbi:MAG TPA: TIGR02587 family membrane protein [Rubricoccaceae bacterium]|nr:TIGR02587 family membrane protein [Rubricoccaceae bacterium]
MTARPIRESLQEYARGLAGGLLFSLPLLYTMEMWWAGHNAPPERLLVIIALTFVLLLGYNHFAGLREESDLASDVFESIEEMGLGLLLALLMLAVLGQLTADASVGEVVGKVVMEGMTAAIGLSVGTEQLGDITQPERLRRMGREGEIVLAGLGAVLVAANVAPTEEVLMIAVETSPWALIGLAALSVAMAWLLLHYSEFKGAGRVARTRLTGFALGGAIVTYAVALAMAAALLWADGRFDGAGWVAGVRQVVVLGFPAVLGAAAARLLLGAGLDEGEDE